MFPRGKQCNIYSLLYPVFYFFKISKGKEYVSHPQIFHISGDNILHILVFCSSISIKEKNFCQKTKSVLDS